MPAIVGDVGTGILHAPRIGKGDPERDRQKDRLTARVEANLAHDLRQAGPSSARQLTTS